MAQVAKPSKSRARASIAKGQDAPRTPRRRIGATAWLDEMLSGMTHGSAGGPHAAENATRVIEKDHARVG
jgi:hypothetical protein